VRAIDEEVRRAGTRRRAACAANDVFEQQIDYLAIIEHPLIDSICAIDDQHFGGLILVEVGMFKQFCCSSASSCSA
jgi:hypothetical protein